MSQTKKRSLTIMVVIVITFIISYFLFFNTENISVEVVGTPAIKGNVVKIMF